MSSSGDDRKRIPVRTGIGKIVVERQKQQIKKGYTLEHDAHHKPGEFLDAARAYLEFAWQSLDIEERTGKSLTVSGKGWESLTRYAESMWPWEIEGFNVDSTEDALVKAGAMIAAALDRNSLFAVEEEATEDDVL